MSRQMRIFSVVGRQLVRTTLTPAVRSSGPRQVSCLLSERACLLLHQNLRSFVSSRNLGFAQSGACSSEQKPETAAEGADVPKDTPEEGEVTDEKDKLLAEKEQEVKDLNDRLLRSYAETENLRTRMTRQADDAKKFAIQGFVKELLDVADNLRRAVDAVPDDASKAQDMDVEKALSLLNSLKEGVVLTERQLFQVFGKNGVVKYDSLNEP